jgi:hypothetical protein
MNLRRREIIRNGKKKNQIALHEEIDLELAIDLSLSRLHDDDDYKDKYNEVTFLKEQNFRKIS